MTENMPIVERGVPAEDGRPGTLLRFPYNKHMIEAIKNALPTGDRYWTGDAWWVSEACHDEAVALLHVEYAEVMIVGMEGESDYILDRHGRTIEQPGLFD